MACQIETLAGSIERVGKSHSSSESDLEIVNLEHTLKEKLFNGNENMNGNISDDFAEAGSSTSNNIIENGHDKSGHDTDSEVDVELQLTPKKSIKGKKEKISPKTSNKRTPSKKDIIEEEAQPEGEYKANVDDITTNVGNDDIDDDVELESTPTKSSKGKKSNRRTPSKRLLVDEETVEPLQDVQLEYKDSIDVNDEDSVIDVEIEDPIGYDIYGVQKQVSGNSSGHIVKEGESSFFSRLRNTMRFSTTTTTTSHTNQEEEEALSDYRKRLRELRSITGRRPLRDYSSWEVSEPNLSRKRKLECESPDTPKSKYLMTSFSERSPGWMFFTSPFHRFWSPKTSSVDTNSTPMRQLHEDVESMTVNVGDAIDDSLEVDDLEITTDEEEKDIDVQKKDVDKKPELQDPQAKWKKCIVM